MLLENWEETESPNDPMNTSKDGEVEDNVALQRADHKKALAREHYKKGRSAAVITANDASIAEQKSLYVWSYADSGKFAKTKAFETLSEQIWTTPITPKRYFSEDADDIKAAHNMIERAVLTPF